MGREERRQPNFYNSSTRGQVKGIQEMCKNKEVCVFEGGGGGDSVSGQAIYTPCFFLHQVPLPDGHTSNHLPLITDNSTH